jgi:hypothetical protein
MVPVGPGGTRPVRPRRVNFIRIKFYVSTAQANICDSWQPVCKTVVETPIVLFRQHVLFCNIGWDRAIMDALYRLPKSLRSVIPRVATYLDCRKPSAPGHRARKVE